MSGLSLRAAAVRVSPPRPGLVRRVRAAFEHAIEGLAARRQLSELDDRMLKDLGISRAQAAFEASRGWHRR